MKVPPMVIAGVVVAGVTLSASQLVVPGRSGPITPAKLSPTTHPPVPNDLASMWLVSAQSARLGPAMTNFVRGVRLLEEDDNPAAALPLVSDGALSTTPVADYARYYTGLALAKLDRHAEAESVFADLSARQIDGHLPEDAAFQLAGIREAQRDYKGAVAVYESLLLKKLAQPQLAWLRLGLAADLAGQPMRSVEALQRAYYDFPATAEADQAGQALDKQDVDLEAPFAAKELARAETLFQARRWTSARQSYDRVKSFVAGDQRDRVLVRIAATEIALGRHREGRDALRPYQSGPLAEEAGFHFITATRGLKLKDEHIELAHAFVEKYPNSAFAEDVLNNLASAYIIDDQDDEADKVFREILNRYPAGRFTERAAWKAGWRAYRQGQFADALQYFDRGAAQFPRSDYRPSWLYWSARAAQEAGDIETGVARLRLTATDYHNSYYGRLAVKRLEGERGGAAIAPTLQRQPLPSTAIPTAGRIAALLSVGLNREAMSELQYAQRVWGDSAQLQATIAVTHKRLGNVRAGINAMKRAYPQYLAAGGETLPAEILQSHLSGRLLAAAAEVFEGAQPRSVSGRGAGRAGVEFRSGRGVPCERLRPDADPAEHRPQLRPETGRAAVLDEAVEGSRGQRSSRHADFLGRHPQVWRRPFRAGRLQRRRQPRGRLATREARPAAGRVHRRHPVSGNAELRQANTWNGGRLSLLV